MDQVRIGGFRRRDFMKLVGVGGASAMLGSLGLQAQAQA